MLKALEILENIKDIDKKVEALTEKAACEEKNNSHERAKDLYMKAMKLGENYAPLFVRYVIYLIDVMFKMS